MKIVGECAKYFMAKVSDHKAKTKCIPLGCNYFRQYDEYPRRLKVSIKELIQSSTPPKDR